MSSPLFPSMAPTGAPAPVVVHAFPDYPVDSLPPALLVEWEDVSYRNDACPAFIKALRGHPVWHLWVDYPEPERRECPTAKRFALNLLHGEELTYLASSETWEPIAALLYLLEQMRPQTAPRAV